MNNVMLGIAVLLMTYGCVRELQAQTNEMQSDRAHRDMAIRWPAAYNPSVASVFSHNELLIHADCQRTFANLADATAWPNWLVIVKDVANETPGKTGEGVLYRLKSSIARSNPALLSSRQASI